MMIINGKWALFQILLKFADNKNKIRKFDEYKIFKKALLMKNGKL